MSEFTQELAMNALCASAKVLVFLKRGLVVLLGSPFVA
jgi:predicted DNA-binding transcriptional regulator